MSWGVLGEMKPAQPLPTTGHKITINADDFGYSQAVNTAILRSFEQILITSASMLANMPGFEDAVHLLETHKFLPRHIGLHLNLTEGYPVSEEIRSCSRFCDEEGRFIYDRRRPLFLLTRRERKAVFREMCAQMDRLIAAGIQPTHLDAHHHIHTHWVIAKLLARLGRRYHIRKIRLTRNFFLNFYLFRLAGISAEVMVHPSQHPLLSGLA